MEAQVSDIFLSIWNQHKMSPWAATTKLAAAVVEQSKQWHLNLVPTIQNCFTDFEITQ